jgi:hypothetical protein
MKKNAKRNMENLIQIIANLLNTNSYLMYSEKLNNDLKIKI